ncbi:MAG: type II secretion system protein [Phycisphaeraceae bacterium]
MNTTSIHPHPQQRPRPPARRAFSLVEILVVVAIILILVGIGVAVMRTSMDAALANQTKTALASLRACASEYQTVTGKSVTYTSDTTTGGSEDDSILAFTAAAYKVPSCKAFFDGMVRDGLIAKGTDLNASGGFVINDAWEKIIQYRSKQGSGAALPQYDNPFFASAGNDSLWGKVNGTAAQQEEARDNLYSYDIK